MNNFLNSVSAKIIFIGILILGLMIPSFMVQNLVSERESRQFETEQEVALKWGQAQTFLGPTIEIPFRTAFRDKENKVYYENHVKVLAPKNISIAGTLDPEIRTRGIFEVVLYQSDFLVDAEFETPEFSENSEIFWDQVRLIFSVSDPQGLRVNPEISFHEKNIPFLADEHSNFSAGLSGFSESDFKNHFKFSLKLNGHENFSITPTARKTNVKLESSWETPGFTGRSLPVSHETSENGFVANWEVLNFAGGQNFNAGDDRDFKASSFVEQIPPISDFGDPVLQNSSVAFGVNLLLPVDFYQQNERAVKYALLFIVLTFTAFFLFEILSPEIRVHPIQYLLIGLAMILFYSVLLALSEHFRFWVAYLIAVFATILLIVFYSASILKKKSALLLLTAFLMGIYLYLFVILNLQDFAFLAGTILLFVILAAVMILTRKIDWYGK